MHVTVWTYPWDVARLGAATVVDDLRRQGADGIDLAATYHPISALSPRGDHVQGFFSPRGGVFFPARPERYGRIRPTVLLMNVHADQDDIKRTADAVLGKQPPGLLEYMLHPPFTSV